MMAETRTAAHAFHAGYEAGYAASKRELLTPQESNYWIRRYNLRPTDRKPFGWAIIVIDSKGLLSIFSDFGNYSHHWPSESGDFREFLIQLERDYLCGKLAPDRCFREDLTISRVRDAICSIRRAQMIDKFQAQEEWQLAESIDGQESFKDWVERSNLPRCPESGMERWELSCYGIAPRALAFHDRVWSYFTNILKQELGYA